MRRSPWFASIACAAILAACSGGGDPPTATGSLSLGKDAPSGDNQSAAAGGQLTLPLRVVVQRNGSPAPGITVTWSVTAGGGSLSSASSTTNAGGVATVRWTLGTSGAQSAQASVPGATGSPLSFSATIFGGASPSVVEVPAAAHVHAPPR